jgi:hypothetical protein
VHPRPFLRLTEADRSPLRFRTKSPQTDDLRPDERIACFTGAMPIIRRGEMKRRFNADPTQERAARPRANTRRHEQSSKRSVPRHIFPVRPRSVFEHTGTPHRKWRLATRMLGLGLHGIRTAARWLERRGALHCNALQRGLHGDNAVEA